MGLFDRLTRKKTSFQSRRSGRFRYSDYGIDIDFGLGSIHVTSKDQLFDPASDARWYGPAEHVEVAGFSMSGGMIYVGESLPSATGWNEPSLIDPALRVNRRNLDRSGKHLAYWLTYDSIPPTSRGAYLEWLAEGRRSASTPIGYVFLFMYGLERRVLVDIVEDGAPVDELSAIRAEMIALLDTYGDDHVSFRIQATEFIGLIDLITGDTAMDVATPPPLETTTWSIPLELRIALGHFAAHKQPIPAEWALAWSWYSPDVPRRTPITRCTDAFSRLFPIHYRERFGDGLIVRPGKRRVTFAYRPASSALRGGSMELDGIPDVFHYKGPTGKLALCLAGVSAELDAYSRWIGHDPGRGRMLAALARLPEILIDDSFDEIRQFRRWATDQLKGESKAVLQGEAFIARWQSSNAERLSKPEATFLARMLGHIGFGIEPDVRFGGQSIAAQRPVILFRLEGTVPESASSAYAAATVLAHLAAAVIGAGDAEGIRASREASRLSDHVGTVLHLNGAERARLDAHVALLASADIKLTGLTKRLEDLGDTGRTALGEILVDLAADSGMVSPAKVTMLTRTYRMLKLDPASVPSRMHARMTGSRPGPAREPVLVRPAGADEPGYRIPFREDQGVGTPAGAGFALDHATIQQRLADSDAVSNLLGSIFEEPEDDSGCPANVPERVPEPDVHAPDEAPLAGLDLAHSRLLREIVIRDVWTRAEFDALAGRHHLMPDGALDTLNEAALDAADDPLIEGDEPLRINRDAVQELVA